MKITTPTATLGIRGTTGLVEVPEGAAANNPNNVAVKLYPDADGRVGRIEVNDRAGARLGFLTQGASGFTIRPGAGGARFAAVPLVIPQAVMLRDQGFVRQLHSTQNVGRQLVFQQREFRRANPGFVNPNRPIRQFQPGQRGQMVCPDSGARSAGQPPLPAVPNRPGHSSPASSIVPDSNRPVEPARSAATPGAPTAKGNSSRARQRNRDCRRGRDSRSPGSPNQPGLPPRAGQPPRSDLPPQPGLPPRAGQPQQPKCRRSPARRRRRPGLPNRFGVPGLQRAARRSGSAGRAASGTARRARRPRPPRNAAATRQRANGVWRARHHKRVHARLDALWWCAAAGRYPPRRCPGSATHRRRAASRPGHALAKEPEQVLKKAHAVRLVLSQRRLRRFRQRHARHRSPRPAQSGRPVPETRAHSRATAVRRLPPAAASPRP